MMGIVSPELFDDELSAVVRAGGYASERDAVGHALEVLMAANRQLRVGTAVELYRDGKVTLARAAEIAGLDMEGLKGALVHHAVPMRVDESPEDVRAGADTIARLRSRV